MEIIRLEPVSTLVLEAKEPWDFRHSVWKPSHFRTDLEIHTAAESWRTLRVGEMRCGLHMAADGAAAMKVRLFADQEWTTEAEAEVVQRLRWSYGLDEDLDPFLRLADGVPLMASPLKRLRGMRLSCPESLFEIAVLSLLLQNTTVARTTQMTRNLLHHYGTLVRFDVATLRAMFTPDEVANVAESDLRELDRLGYRAKFLPRFAQFFAARDLPTAVEEEGLIPLLMNVKGVGPYTAGVIASHACRSFAALGLDVWNTRLLGDVLLGRERASQAEVRTCLDTLFPGHAGLAAMYLVESKYLEKPVVGLMESREAVRNVGDDLISQHEPSQP